MPVRPPPGGQAAPKAVDIQVLHCLNPDCRGLLAYEVDSNNVLYLDLAWTAKSENGQRFFPCPKCHGKNVIEDIRTDKGRVKQRVARWEPANPNPEP